MHIHKIDKQTHADFLGQNRQDPITGDLIVAGDEIVFCNECKSAFLKDTWEYLGGRHCNQNRTLAVFPVRKTLNLKSKREYFKAYLHSISDWKEFDTRLKTLPWVLSSLDMKEFRKKSKNSMLRLVLFVTSLLLVAILCYLLSFSSSVFMLFLLITGIGFIGEFLSRSLKSVDKSEKPQISIEKDQIIVFMPYKEQKVTLAKYKIEEIELISKEKNNYKLRVSYTKGSMFFSFYLAPRQLSSLVETLYDWSDSVRIDLRKTKFLLKGMNDYSYLYASLDAEEEEPHLLLP
ncbi:hypothetical protein [Bernardetia sp.]|uniref:hypothetical protein n=1 Tax=Bernardetia sp. TaxID=1937974 RepID=UPI0025B9469F|nr:hypothetical protein [Bernardetia sp.]